jgi:hypothetical protein
MNFGKRMTEADVKMTDNAEANSMSKDMMPYGSVSPNAKKSVSKSPKKKRKPHESKPKPASQAREDAFEIERPNEFRELNNTRKVHYPMML